jgi:hypothetical protein
MATFKKLPKSATLILIRASRFDEDPELVRSAITKLKEQSPKTFGKIHLFRVDNESSEKSMHILEESTHKVNSCTKASSLDVKETMEETVSFIRKQVLQGGLYFFIIPVGKINGFLKTALKVYDKNIPNFPVVWARSGLVVFNANTEDMAYSSY